MRQPDGASAGVLPILDDVIDELEAGTVEQHPVFLSVEARMIERIAAIFADRLAMGRTAILHQHGGRRRMPYEHLEHHALIVGLEVKKAVPSEHALETTIDPQ